MKNVWYQLFVICTVIVVVSAGVFVVYARASSVESSDKEYAKERVVGMVKAAEQTLLSSYKHVASEIKGWFSVYHFDHFTGNRNSIEYQNFLSRFRDGKDAHGIESIIVFDSHKQIKLTTIESAERLEKIIESLAALNDSREINKLYVSHSTFRDMITDKKYVHFMVDFFLSDVMYTIVASIDVAGYYSVHNRFVILSPEVLTYFVDKTGSVFQCLNLQFHKVNDEIFNGNCPGDVHGIIAAGSELGAELVQFDFKGRNGNTYAVAAKFFNEYDVGVISIEQYIEKGLLDSISIQEGAVFLILLSGVGVLPLLISRLISIRSGKNERYCRIEELLRISKTGFYEWNSKQGLVFCSEQVYRHFEIPSVNGKHKLELFLGCMDDEVKTRLFELCDKMKQMPGQYTFNCPVVLSSEAKKNLQAYLVVYHEKGMLVRVVGTLHDDTDRQATEYEIEELHEKIEQILQENSVVHEHENSVEQKLDKKSRELELILKTVPDLLFHVRVDTTIESYHCSSLSDLYLPPEEFIGKKMVNVLPDPAAGLIGRAVLDSLVSREVMRVEYSLIIEEVETYFEARIAATEENHCLVIVRNVSEMVNAQMKAEALSRALALSPVSVILMNESRIIEYVNNKYCAVTGFTEDEIVGRHLSEIGSASHDDEFYGAIVRQAADGEEWHGEIHNRKKDGTLFWERASVSVIRHENGEISNFILVSEDITRVKEMVEDLEKAKELAEDGVRAKATFLASMSHELRTPLNSIIGFGQLLEKRIRDLEDIKAKEYLAKINTSGSHLQKLVTDILDLAKIDSHALNFSIEPINLNALIEESFDVVEHLIDKDNISLRSTIRELGEVKYGLADYIRLKQVIINVLTNAIKYNRPNGMVEVAIISEGVRHCIDIKDTGYGIAQDKLSEIFEPFHRIVQDNETVEGTGIGLTISKKIVTAMNGSLEVLSSSSEGTVFRISVLKCGKGYNGGEV